MLTQHRIVLSADQPCSPKPEWGYRLYAALLDAAPASFGQNLHQDTVTPVSQYFTAENGLLCWTITLLGQECQECLGPVLWEQNHFYLRNDGVLLRVREQTAQTVSTVEELLAWAEGCTDRHRLSFQTATAFKSRGQYLNLPTSRLIIQSLIKKWNGCFPDCPIEDEDEQGMEALANGLCLEHFRLYDRAFRLKGNMLPGFVGPLVIENRLHGFHRLLANALLRFSGYAGIGIKTALGMGGVEYNNI